MHSLSEIFYTTEKLYQHVQLPCRLQCLVIIIMLYHFLGQVKLDFKHTHNRLTAFFSRTIWVGRYQKDKPFWILLKQEMTGWQWHQLNHMQIICTSLQTDNHASTSLLHIFCRPDALPAAQPTASKH